MLATQAMWSTELQGGSLAILCPDSLHHQLLPLVLTSHSPGDGSALPLHISFYCISLVLRFLSSIQEPFFLYKGRTQTILASPPVGRLLARKAHIVSDCPLQEEKHGTGSAIPGHSSPSSWVGSELGFQIGFVVLCGSPWNTHSSVLRWLPQVTASCFWPP